jgi:hypothetical protein
MGWRRLDSRCSSNRDCERSDLSAEALAKAEAIQSFRGGILDCFVASLLAMTVETVGSHGELPLAFGR